jgi:hypothetical protein
MKMATHSSEDTGNRFNINGKVHKIVRDTVAVIVDKLEVEAYLDSDGSMLPEFAYKMKKNLSEALAQELVHQMVFTTKDDIANGNRIFYGRIFLLEE